MVPLGYDSMLVRVQGCLLFAYHGCGHVIVELFVTVCSIALGLWRRLFISCGAGWLPVNISSDLSIAKGLGCTMRTCHFDSSSEQTQLAESSRRAA